MTNLFPSLLVETSYCGSVMSGIRNVLHFDNDSFQFESDSRSSGESNRNLVLIDPKADLRQLIEAKRKADKKALKPFDDDDINELEASSPIPRTLLAQLKTTLFKLGSEEQFTCETFEAKYQFRYRTKIPIPSGMTMQDLTSELCRLGILRMKYHNNNVYLFASDTFLEDFLMGQSEAPIPLSQIYGLSIQIRNYFPIKDNVMQYKDNFTVQKLPSGLGTGDMIDVYLSDITNPSSFYIQLIQTGNDLSKLMDDMDDFYPCNRDPNYEISAIVPGIVGLCVAALYFESEVCQGWHRGIITKIMNLDQVQVFYVDYGTKSLVRLDFIRFLRKDFGQLPAQAIKTRLGGIKPKTLRRKETTSTANWSMECCMRFFGLCHATNYTSVNKGVVAQILAFKDQKLPELCLYDMVTNNLPNGINFAEVLLNEGFASRRKRALTRYGLLPWQYPEQQLHEEKAARKKAKTTKKKKSTAAAAETSNFGSSSGSQSSILEFDVPEYVKKLAIDKVTSWLNDKSNDFDDLEVNFRTLFSDTF